MKELRIINKTYSNTGIYCDYQIWEDGKLINEGSKNIPRGYDRLVVNFEGKLLGANPDDYRNNP